MDNSGNKKKRFSIGETDKERRNNLIVIFLAFFPVGYNGIVFYAAL